MSKLTVWGWEWIHHSPVYQSWQSSQVRRWLGRATDFCLKNRFSLQILLILTYRLALDLLYVKVISPLYGYAGLTMNFHPLFYGCTLLALLVISPAVARLQEECISSSNLVTFLNYIYFIPLTSYCGCNWSGMGFFLAGLAYWTVLLLFQFHIPVLRFKPSSGGHRRWIYVLLTVLAVAVVMYVSGRYASFRLTFDIINVYDIRAEAAAYPLPGLISYALSMAGSVLAILLVYWLLRRKYMVCAVLVVVYMFLFSIAANKSLFFFLLLVLASFSLFRPWMRQWLPALATAVAVAALLEYRFVHSYFLAGRFFRRVMYVPISLSVAYRDYFRDNPVSLFRSGILRWFSFSTIYSGNVANIIGAFRGHPNTHANNGLLGDLYSNLPFLLGLVLLPLILVICFRLLDVTAKNLPEKLVVSSCVFFAISFSNVSWSTVLLSNGFLITCLLLYIFPEEGGLSQ